MKFCFLIILSFLSYFSISSYGTAQNEAKQAVSLNQQTENIPEVLPETFDSILENKIKENETSFDWNAPDDSFRRQILEMAYREYLNWPKPPKIRENLLAPLKINHLTGKYIEFYTDMPLNDSIQEIPVIADSAVSFLCQYFQIDQNDLTDWRVEAFLMKTKEPFQKLGVLERVPNFPHGYSTGFRIFAMDHHIDYYNHFLLLHELVHAFMYRIFGSLNPRWFSEGMAEYLGLHLWNDQKLTLGIIPEQEDQIEGFGRLRLIREKVQKNDVPSLKNILNFVPADFREVETYAWSWAFVLFLDRHPDYHENLQKMNYYMIFPDANKRFVALFENRWDKLENDWKAFLLSFDYSYDFRFVQRDSSLGKPLDSFDQSQLIFKVSAAENWQNSGVRVEFGQNYRIDAIGRYQIAHPRKKISCEPNGITFEYYSGRPWGQLLAVVVPDLETGMTFDEFYQKQPLNSPFQRMNGRKTSQSNTSAKDQNFNKEKKTKSDLLFPWNEIVAFDSTTKILNPNISGTLFFKINVPVSVLSQNKGNIKVRIQKAAQSRL
ncbi:MAG: hypothetical protein Q4C95_05225 [Planctomycetia bacterium]|nr:hypothetical protein [Planctomycetia bacterium]